MLRNLLMLSNRLRNYTSVMVCTQMHTKGYYSDQSIFQLLHCNIQLLRYHKMTKILIPPPP